MTDPRALSPLLEFDPERTAFIEPSTTIRRRDVPDACVLTWFHDAASRFIERHSGRVVVRNHWEDGFHPLYEVVLDGRRLGIAPMPVGAPPSAGLLEELIAFGCRRFIACGGAGALHPELTLGHLVVVTSALRDEGTSHHYLPPGRVIDADADAVAVIESTLTRRGVPFVTGRTWTTDAFYRETAGRIAARRDEGCLTVEMEAAAIAAVAGFRGVPLGQMLYCGDDLAGQAWDHRDWSTQHEARDNVLELAVDAVLRLAEPARS